jgi:putative endonuclease
MEAVARAYLERRGLRFVAANFRAPRGEVDLVMQDGDDLVFVEVRYRAGSGHGGAAASVDARKQRRLVHAANAWLSRARAGTAPCCRFDVVALQGDADDPRIEWIAGAFVAAD